MTRTVHCYAEGRPGDWEAICLDLDIAVQGESLEDVVASLQKAMRLYLEEAVKLPPADRDRLLNRSVPLRLRLRVLGRVIATALRGDGPGGQGHADFTLPVAA